MNRNKKGTRGWNENTTQYAKKRRLLREHRDEMRIMFDLIDAYGFEFELNERLLDETGNNGFWLGYGPHDLGSDEEEDPEENLREEVRELKSQLTDRTALIQALTEHRRKNELEKALLDMERARMKCEDRPRKTTE